MIVLYFVVGFVFGASFGFLFLHEMCTLSVP